MFIEPNYEIIKEKFIINSSKDSHIIRFDQQAFIDHLHMSGEEHSLEIISLQAYDNKNNKMECINTLEDDIKAVQVITSEDTEYPITIDVEARVILPFATTYDNYTPYFERLFSAYYCRAYDMVTGQEVFRADSSMIDSLPGSKDTYNGMSIGNCGYFSRALHTFSPTYHYESTWYKYSKTNNSCTEIPEFKNILFLKLINASDNFVRLFAIFTEGKSPSSSKAVLRQAYIYASIDSDGNLGNITIIKDDKTYESRSSFTSAPSTKIVHQDSNELIYYDYYTGVVRINKKENIFTAIDSTKSFIYYSVFHKTEDGKLENIYADISGTQLKVDFYTGTAKEIVLLDAPEGFLYKSTYTKPYMYYGEDNKLYAYISYTSPDNSYGFITRIDKFEVDYPNKTLNFLETVIDVSNTGSYLNLNFASDNQMYSYSYSKNYDYTFVKGIHITGIDRVSTISSLKTQRIVWEADKHSVCYEFDTERKILSQKKRLEISDVSSIENESGTNKLIFGGRKIVKESFENEVTNAIFKWSSNYDEVNGFTRSNKYSTNGEYSGFIGTTKGSSTLYTEATVRGSKISFDYLVSSELSYDFFRFYIDGAEKLKVSGTTMTEMKNVEYELDSSKDTVIRFEYKNDSSGDRGDSGFYIDNIALETTYQENEAEIYTVPFNTSDIVGDEHILEYKNLSITGDVIRIDYYSLDNGLTWNELEVLTDVPKDKEIIFKSTFVKEGQAEASFDELCLAPKPNGIKQLIMYPSIRALLKDNTINETIHRSIAINNELNVDSNRSIAVTLDRKVSTRRSSSIDSKSKFKSHRQIISLDCSTGQMRRTVIKNDSVLAYTNRSISGQVISLYNTLRAVYDGSTITINGPTVRKIANNSSEQYPHTLRKVTVNHNTITDTIRRTINDYNYNYSTRRIVFDGTVETVEAPTIRTISKNDSILGPTSRLKGNLVEDSFNIKRAIYITREEAALYNVNIELSGIATF